MLQRVEESALTQKIFEDFQNQGPCISPTSTYPKLRYPAQGFLRESPLIVLHLASFQLCCMMIKCAFTQKSSEKLKLFSKNRKCYQTLYTIESPDNEQLFLPLHRRCCKATNHPKHGKDTDLKHRRAACITDTSAGTIAPLYLVSFPALPRTFPYT